MAGAIQNSSFRILAQLNGFNQKTDSNTSRRDQKNSVEKLFESRLDFSPKGMLRDE
jgi:hypothetical protein